MLQLAGQFDEALDHYRRALALRPDNVEARGNLAQLLSRQGRSAEAVAEFDQVLAVSAEDPQALSGLAWIRATAADAALRNPGQAIQLAERAAALTRRRDLAALDALAAAYAAAGRFDDGGRRRAGGRGSGRRGRTGRYCRPIQSSGWRCIRSARPTGSDRTVGKAGGAGRSCRSSVPIQFSAAGSVSRVWLPHFAMRL